MTFKPVEELTFTDDFMFGYVLRDPEICKTLLETLLGIQIDYVEYPELQKSISSFYESKGVRLDVYIKGSNRVFDIEIQNDFQLALPRRTRYYQSMIDMDDLLKGADYSELKESFIIFVCQFDPFKADCERLAKPRDCGSNMTADRFFSRFYGTNDLIGLMLTIQLL